jgi:hypothetical protein
MRDYLNQILSFIGTESLTDEEFASITLENTDDQIAVYQALLAVLQSRDLVSDDMTMRLQNYFLAKGVPVVTVTKMPVSNIFVGAVLDE